MIQRIQTVYLFFAAAFMLAYYMFPIAIFTTDIWAFEFFNCHLTHPENLQPPVTLAPLAILPLLSIILSLVAIFLFKRRKLQIRLGKLNMLLIFFTIILEFFYFKKIGTMLEGDVTYGFSGIIPFVVLILVIMAHRGIKNDEKLVRAADRIR